MALPLTVDFDLGESEVADGSVVRVAARVTLAITIDGIPASRRGLFSEYHLRDALRRLLDRLADPLAWRAALGDDDEHRDGA